jgi:hypothetical protein
VQVIERRSIISAFLQLSISKRTNCVSRYNLHTMRPACILPPLCCHHGQQEAKLRRITPRRWKGISKSGAIMEMRRTYLRVPSISQLVYLCWHARFCYSFSVIQIFSRTFGVHGLGHRKSKCLLLFY